MQRRVAARPLQFAGGHDPIPAGAEAAARASVARQP